VRSRRCCHRKQHTIARRNDSGKASGQCITSIPGAT
jgi:hypothetical protein